jgi:predicted amidophosphoribosyltransferase
MNLKRGFSPARILARHVARRADLPLHGGLLVKRIGSPVTVKRLGARARRQRGAETFRVRRSVAGARLLLIDDVMTTGESVEGAARALKRAGASEVRAVVWARTLPDPGRRGPAV